MTIGDFKNPATGKDKEVQVFKDSVDAVFNGASMFTDSISFLKYANAGLAALSGALSIAGFFVSIFNLPTLIVLIFYFTFTSLTSYTSLDVKTRARPHRNNYQRVEKRDER
jgi:hypothetical protein